jgi:hypothetical protein
VARAAVQGTERRARPALVRARVEQAAAQLALEPHGATRERRALARSRGAAFRQPWPGAIAWADRFHRARETASAGTWQLGGVVDYVAKLCLA